MPKLILSLPDSGEKTFDLDAETITVGRSNDNDIQIDDASVSGSHARLTRKGATYEFQDLDSTNGSRVNGEPTKNAVLEPGDRVRFGKIEAHFVDEKSSASQPLPESENPAAKLADASTLPSNFSNASSFKAKEKDKDKSGSLLMGFAVLSILAFVAAIARILTLQPPQ